jgi:hypothetical protein
MMIAQHLRRANAPPAGGRLGYYNVNSRVKSCFTCWCNVKNGGKVPGFKGNATKDDALNGLNVC